MHYSQGYDPSNNIDSQYFVVDQCVIVVYYCISLLLAPLAASYFWVFTNIDASEILIFQKFWCFRNVDGHNPYKVFISHQLCF